MTGRSKSEKIVRDIKRQTRRKYSSEDKIRIVLEALRGETSIAELCRREGINPNVYYRWSKDFLEAGKNIGNKELERAVEVIAEFVIPAEGCKVELVRMK